MNKAQKIASMISRLSGDFAKDIEDIRNEIAPEMIGLEKPLFKHYVKMISKKTKTGVQSIMAVIGEVWQEIREGQRQAANDFNSPDVQEAALHFGKDPQAFRKTIDIVNELGVTGNRRAIGQAHATITSRLNPEEPLASKFGESAGSGKSAIAKTA